MKSDNTITFESLRSHNLNKALWFLFGTVFMFTMAHLFIVWNEEPVEQHSISEQYNTPVPHEIKQEEPIREYYNIPLPPDLQDLTVQTLQTFNSNLDETDMYAVMWVESKMNAYTPDSDAGAQGLMQVMPATYEAMQKELNFNYPEILVDRSDVELNLITGVYYLTLIEKSVEYTEDKGNLDRIYTSYNRGIGGANDFYRNNGTYSSYYSREVQRVANFIATHRTLKGINN